MKILVTGSSGFVGKNLVPSLKNLGYDVIEFDRNNSLDDLRNATKVCDFVVHLAGVNRPLNPEEFYEGNSSFSEVLVQYLREAGNKSPIFVSSSIQVHNENDYGKSKLQGEKIIENHGKNNSSKVFIYRFPNLYGKWSKPNYNSVIATWCYNVARGLDIKVSDPSIVIKFVYIDDVIKEIIRAINGSPNIENGVGVVNPVDAVSLGEVLDLIKSFKESRLNFNVPNLETRFSKNLYSTYLSYLPNDEFSYPLLMHNDARGSFTEFLKMGDNGQVSINVSKVGITKGQHWHHTKNEKFLVVSGVGEIQLRDIHTSEILTYKVSSDVLEVIDIPVGYTHNIINTGTSEMVTVMWVNEIFDKNNPDTYIEEV